MRSCKWPKTRGGESKLNLTFVDSKLNTPIKNGFETNSKSDSGNLPVGLDNLGNTCYMNAILQCLRCTGSFNRYCSAKEFGPLRKSSKTCGCLYPTLANIIDSLNGSVDDEDPSYALRKFKNVFSKMVPSYSDNRQQDALEFLTYLVNGLHDETNHTTKPIAIRHRRSKLSGRFSHYSQGKSVTPPLLQPDTRLINSFDVMISVPDDRDENCFRSDCDLSNDPYKTLKSPEIPKSRSSTKRRFMQWINRHNNQETSPGNQYSPIEEISSFPTNQANILESIFSGHFETRITCKNCKHITAHRERFWNLALCIPETKIKEKNACEENSKKIEKNIMSSGVAERTEETRSEKVEVSGEYASSNSNPHHTTQNFQKDMTNIVDTRKFHTGVEAMLVDGKKADGGDGKNCNTMSCDFFNGNSVLKIKNKIRGDVRNTFPHLPICPTSDENVSDTVAGDNEIKKTNVLKSSDEVSAPLDENSVSKNKTPKKCNEINSQNNYPTLPIVKENLDRKQSNIHGTHRCPGGNQIRTMQADLLKSKESLSPLGEMFPDNSESPSKISNSDDDLSKISAKDDINLIDCLQTFTRMEILNLDDRPCDMCKVKVNAEFQILISELPEILVLQFQRFDSLSARTKRSSLIKFDFEIDMKDFTTQDSSSNSPRQYSSTPYPPMAVSPSHKRSTTRRHLIKSNDLLTKTPPQFPVTPVNKSTRYSLYAVVYHIGTTDRGHYTARAKLPNPSGTGMCWYYFDDEKVEEITDLSEIIHQTACILFYQRLPAAAHLQLDGNLDSNTTDFRSKSSPVL